MKKNIGIIVGRFQVSELTSGHKYLISEVTKNFDKVIIFIGTTKNDIPDIKNPLPYEARKYMILEDNIISLPKTLITKIEDVGNWKIWVDILDTKIDLIVNSTFYYEDFDIYICGSRDSVLTKYKASGGKYKTYEVSEIPGISGTKARDEIISKSINWDKNSREAVIKTISKIYEKK